MPAIWWPSRPRGMRTVVVSPRVSHRLFLVVVGGVVGGRSGKRQAMVGCLGDGVNDGETTVF